MGSKKMEQIAWTTVAVLMVVTVIYVALRGCAINGFVGP